MARVTVKIVGDVDKKLAALQAGAADALELALKAGAMIVQNEAKARAPKRTSALRRSIIVEVRRNGTTIEARIGPTVEYGKYIEYGTGIYAEGGNGRKTPWVVSLGGGKFFTTRGQRPRPYLRPAFDEKREAALATMGKAFAKLFRG